MKYLFVSRQALSKFQIVARIRTMTTSVSLTEINEHLPVPSLKRQFHGDYQPSAQTLHVLQWNVLAQGLSGLAGNFVRVKADTVAYETRRWRILEQIVLRQPDLCVLEEVDIYDCFLQDHLPKYGYTCFCAPKANSPCFNFQADVDNFKGPDGMLLCYKTQMFDEVHRYHCVDPLEGGVGNNIFALFELKHKPSSTQMVLVGTHFKAKTSFVHVREAQARHLLQYVSKHYPTTAHIIFAGDCNGGLDEAFYPLVRQAGFSSAYRTMLNDREPSFTTLKFRAHDGIEQEQCGCIDYIFYKPEGFSPIAILKLPTKEEIGNNGLPSDAYPSDHLALEAIFTIKS